MFCKYCGFKLPDDAVFCPNCGQKLDTVIPETENDINNDNEPIIPKQEYREFVNNDTEYKSDVNYSFSNRQNQNNFKKYEYTSEDIANGKKGVAIITIIITIIVIVFFACIIGLSGNSIYDTTKITPKPTVNEIGELYITSNPSGAMVTIGGEYKGVTPLTVSVSANTKYAIYVEKSGYNMWSDFVTVNKNGMKTINANLVSRISDSRTQQPTYIPTSYPTQIYYPTSTPVVTATSTDEYYDRVYVWNYNGYEFTHTGSFSKENYLYYKKLSHSNIDLAKYATEKYNRKVAGNIADSISEACDEIGFNEFEKVMAVVTFVQSLPYTSDSVTTGHDEYVRYPIETLVDNGGDCEDTSILTAAILREMGYGVVLLRLPGHVAVGVKGGNYATGTYWTYNNNRYYYLETTGENFDIGELPDSLKGEKAKVIYVS